MAKTSLSVKGTGKNPASIYLRFWESKSIDLEVRTGLYIVPKFWDRKAKRIRNVIDVPNRDDLNNTLILLQAKVISEYNTAFSTGVIIDKYWLLDVIAKYFNRPTGEVKLKNEPHRIYLADYAKWWIKEIAPTYKVKANKYMTPTAIGQYERAINNLNTFEKGKKIKFTEITDKILDSFSQHLTSVEGFTYETTKRILSRIKFFCERAEADNIAINKKYKERVFVQEAEVQYKHPYLSPAEISAIFKANLSHDKELDHARDNLIIGVWTGLRISDFLTRLSIENINGDFIRIKTKKTGHDVTIPLHPMVRSVLEKHNGLPPKMPEQHFNRRIKIVGQLAEIDNEIIGGVVKVDEKTKIKRKVVGLYKKHELITSHICRRSFATNHFGKVSNKIIMDVCGWKKEDMLMNYIQATNMESAIALQKHWENNLI